MSTPRRGVRRPQSQTPPAAQRPAGESRPAAPPAAPRAPRQAPVAVAPQARLWVRVLTWFAWILLWLSAAGAGYTFGKITLSKVLFIAIMLAITVLPWMRYVRTDSVRHLTRDRIAMLQGSLAIFVGLVYVLSAAYLLAVAVVVVQLALAVVILMRSPRPAQAQG